MEKQLPSARHKKFSGDSTIQVTLDNDEKVFRERKTTFPTESSKNRQHETVQRIKSNNTLEIPTLDDGSGYMIVGTESYLKDKKQRRPLSLSSINDLRIVKEENLDIKPQKQAANGNNSKHNVQQNSNIIGSINNSDDKKRLRTLLLASAALAKFKHHASVRRKEKKSSSSSVSPRFSNQLTINDKKRLSLIEVNELFDCKICRRYVEMFDTCFSKMHKSFF